MKSSIKKLLQGHSHLQKDRNLQIAYTMGTTFLACVLIGSAFGYFLYKTFGSIWLLFSFIIFGFLSGIKNVYVDAKKIVANNKKEETTGKNEDI